MFSLGQDLKFALRTMAKSRGFTAIAVLTLALGIGINATVFTLTNTVLLKGFPFDRNDRILYLGMRNTKTNFPNGPLSYADLRDWRAQSKSLTGIAGASGMQANLADGAGLPETHPASQMTANSFQLIGQKPYAGRDFEAADEAPGAAPVAILTYSLWEQRYGKDLGVIGRSIRVNGVPTTVVGIMPQGFTFPFNLDLWIPLVPTAASEKREVRNMFAFGRLTDAATEQTARAEITTIAKNLESSYPLSNQGFVPVIRNYNEFYIGPAFTTMFVAMMVAVAFVLLISCANVANMLLARALGRTREISIRVAHGAGRWRVIRQLLVESLALTVAGGVFGWLIARWAVHLFDLSVIPFGKPRWMDFSMDGHVFAYLAAISAGTGLLFGLAPALQLSKLDVNSSLKEGGRGSSTGAHGRRLSRALVIAEMSLAVVLLAGAGLMIRSFLNVYRANLGVGTSNILTMRLALPQMKYPQGSDQIAFHDRLKTRLEALPGVESVAIANFLPTGGSSSFPYEFEGTPSDAQHRPTLSAVIIGPNYFRAVGVGILRGRAFTDVDGVSGPPVVIVNQRFAGQFLAGEDPIGKRLRIFDNGTAGPFLTIVGVAPNIVQNEISPSQIDPLIYIPYRQKPTADMAILAHTLVPPGTLGNAFRREIQAVDSDLPVYNLWTLQERLERNYWFTRTFAVLFLIFAGIALLLASVGLYALTAHSVGQRTQEIGVRMALGAGPSSILRLVFVTGVRQLAIGLAIGVVAGLAVTRVLRAVLVQVSPFDPVTFIAASLLLILATMLGCWIPARRAMRVDPMVALRYE
jgi:predicted permease